MLTKFGSLLLMVLSVALVSCNDDDDVKTIVPGTPTGTDIRYEVATSANIITKIRYKKGNGDFAFGHSTPDTINDWFMTVVVMFAEQPLNAEVEVTMKNNTGQNQNYTMEIYENGVPVETASGVLESINAEVVVNVTYLVDNTPQ